MTKTISCTLIIRDEASTLPALISSIRPHVDELVIVDTGSKDDSPSIASRSADVFEVWTGCNDAEGRIADFSAARNHALSLATGDCLAWFDGDDLVRGGENLRKLASEAPGPAWAYLMPYEYQRDAAGRVVTLQWRERLVYPRAGFEWRGPVHEGLLAKAGTVPAYMQTDVVTVQHELERSSKPRDTTRNLRILEQHVRKVGETDARNLHYLGAELMYNGRIGEACYWFRRHAQLSGWSDERALSLLHLARISLAMGDWDAAADWALKAVATKSWPEPWWVAGQAYCAMAEAGIEPQYNYQRGAHMLQQGFRADTPAAQSLLMKDPTASHDACAWLAPALVRLGKVDEALEVAKAGLVGNPKHAALAQFVREASTEKARNKVRAGMVELFELGDVSREAGVVVEATLRGDFKVERSAPRDTLLTAGLREFKRVGPKLDSKLDLVFFLGHQLEPWTPRTLEANGMGGSETMAWEMAKRMAARGHRVRVYAHLFAPDANVGTHVQGYDGVEWLDEHDFHNVECDVLICSRRFDAVHAAKYKAAILWVHDVHVGEAFHPRDAAKFDFIWCLSNWHKEFFCSVYPWLSPKKVEVTRNGIDPNRFTEVGAKGRVVRDPHRAIYSSSPDRGLADAVAAWPAVRRAIPDAELHVYYGFENWDRSLEHGENGVPQCSRAARDALKLAVKSTPGVVMHGRVNQKELAEAMLGASVWFYPTWFSETSCITAMEAQAAELICVCPPIAALAETVKRGRWWDTHNAAQAVIEGMNPHLRRGQLADDKPDFSLDTLATAWDARLRAVAQQVVPAFTEPEAAQ